MDILESEDMMGEYLDLILYGIIGFLLCFCGHKISEKIFGIVMFIALASFAYHYATTYYDLEFIWNIAIAVTAGAIGAVLSYTIKQAVFFVMGFVFGFALAHNFLPAETIYLIVCFVIGVITALLANKFADYAITIVLCYFGATYLGQVINHFYDLGAYLNYAVLAITALGFLSQMGAISKSTKI